MAFSAVRLDGSLVWENISLIPLVNKTALLLFVCNVVIECPMFVMDVSSLCAYVGYVVAFSAFNLGGRLVWANLSDTIGQRNTFHIFCATCIPMFLAIPMCTQVILQ